MSRDISSFCGRIDEIPDIGVDNFTLHNKKVYFLSHFHADHIAGLNTKRFLDNLKQTNAKIYMSEVTSVIVDYEYCDNNTKNGLLQYITPLKIGKILFVYILNFIFFKSFNNEKSLLMKICKEFIFDGKLYCKCLCRNV